MNFSDRLKQLRVSKNLTQVEVANSIIMSERGYQRLELGETKPKYETIINLCNYFNVSADYLLGLSDNPKRNE